MANADSIQVIHNETTLGMWPLYLVYVDLLIFNIVLKLGYVGSLISTAYLDYLWFLWSFIYCFQNQLRIWF